MSCEYAYNFCAPTSFQMIALQSVEVGCPNATYELTVKTAMPRGSAIPKGRISLPREPKPKPKDKVLVFADGKAVEEAKRAGADIVGGAELVEAVR
jgi:large subunit ribosomal protein L1